MDQYEKARLYAEGDADNFLPSIGGGMYGTRHDAYYRNRLEQGGGDPAFQTWRNLDRRTTDDSPVMGPGGESLERSRMQSIYGPAADALGHTIRQRAEAPWQGQQSMEDMGHFERLRRMGPDAAFAYLEQLKAALSSQFKSPPSADPSNYAPDNALARWRNR